MVIRVTKPYSPANAEPVALVEGETVTTLREDTEYPGWQRCRAEDGREAWVHISYLAGDGATRRLRRDYSSLELSVVPGDNGQVKESLGGWYLVSLPDARCGWLPAACATVQ